MTQALKLLDIDFLNSYDLHIQEIEKQVLYLKTGLESMINKVTERVQ